QHLLTSVKTPTSEEVQANIETFLGPEGRLAPTKRGHKNILPGQVMMVDGIALEEVCRFCPICNVVLGLCREHSDHINTTVRSLESIDAIEKAIEDDHSVCHGKDGTVVSIAPIAPVVEKEHYTPLTIALSASCKKEKGKTLAKWLGDVIVTYASHPHGEQVHGPILSLATDGESSF
ncbi:hypothetical protein BDZ94DRAFT_1343982, partial [Collybia nuda]